MTETTRLASWLSASVFAGTVVSLAGLLAGAVPAMWIGAICLMVGGNGLRWITEVKS